MFDRARTCIMTVHRRADDAWLADIVGADRADCLRRATFIYGDVYVAEWNGE